MSSLNKIMLIGNLGKDPEIKELPTGKLFAKLSLATNEKYKGETKTTWHSIVVWDEKKAELLEQYTKKGSKLYVEGSLESRKYTDKEGIERYAYEVVVGAFNGAIRLLDPKGDDAPDERTATTRKPPPTTTRPAPAKSATRIRSRSVDEAFNRELDDEVPF